jgi:hypothetical protein
MSLEALNYPPLVTAVGAGALVALPILEGVNLSLLTLKCATVIAYWINFAAVSVPGRIDGAQAEAREAMEQLSPGRQGRTLLSPAGWYEGASGTLRPILYCNPHQTCHSFTNSIGHLQYGDQSLPENSSFRPLSCLKALLGPW